MAGFGYTCLKCKVARWELKRAWKHLRISPLELLQATIDVIRQSLQADGGDVVLVNCDKDGVVTLEMQGACAGCPMSTYDMSEGIERILKEHVPGVTKVQPAMAW